jgi:hypothetical protein
VKRPVTVDEAANRVFARGVLHRLWRRLFRGRRKLATTEAARFGDVGYVPNGRAPWSAPPVKSEPVTAAAKRAALIRQANAMLERPKLEHLVADGSPSAWDRR